MGTLFSLPVVNLGSHNDLINWTNEKKSEIGKIDIIGTTVKTSLSIDDVKFKTPLILLIGSETFVLSENYKKICDKLVKIPIKGSASSLNVACATSIFLNEINRQIERN